MDKNLKAFIEKRSSALEKMKALTDKAIAEVRAFTADEAKEWDALKAEVEGLNKTIDAFNEQRDHELENAEQKNVGTVSQKTPTKQEQEERAFVEFIRTGKDMGVETRADSNFTHGDNGAVIPSSIANKIIEKVIEISPVFAGATKYYIGGTLTIPYYDESTGMITTQYAEEFTDGEATSGKLLSISLTGFLARTLTKVSKRLINNSQFDILSYVVNKVAESVARWLDNELINGTEDKIEGLSGITQLVTAAGSTPTSDELIELQDTVPDAFQSGSIWLMSRKMRTAVRKLKDGEGNYLLNKDATSKWGYTLFGKPVYIADAVPDDVILYGDLSGLAIKISENASIEVLREKYVEQHAVGIVAWLEMDSKVENAQKLAKLKMTARSRSSGSAAA